MKWIKTSRKLGGRYGNGKLGDCATDRFKTNHDSKQERFKTETPTEEADPKQLDHGMTGRVTDAA